MTSTFFLAELAGLTAAVVGLAGLYRRKVIMEVIHGLVENRALLFVLGVIDTAGAITMILIHNDWSGSTLSLVVTLLGWVLLVRGFLRLTLSDKAIRGFVKFLNLEKNFYLLFGLMFLCGLWLAWAGFTA